MRVECEGPSGDLHAMRPAGRNLSIGGCNFLATSWLHFELEYAIFNWSRRLFFGQMALPVLYLSTWIPSAVERAFARGYRTNLHRSLSPHYLSWSVATALAVLGQGTHPQPHARTSTQEPFQVYSFPVRKGDGSYPRQMAHLTTKRRRKLCGGSPLFRFWFPQSRACRGSELKYEVPAWFIDLNHVLVMHCARLTELKIMHRLFIACKDNSTAAF